MVEEQLPLRPLYLAGERLVGAAGVADALAEVHERHGKPVRAGDPPACSTCPLRAMGRQVGVTEHR